MTRSHKIGVGIGVVLLLAMVCAATAAIYFVVNLVQARALFNEGYKAMNRRDYEKAVQQFDDALRRHLDPSSSAYAYLDRGYCQEKLRHQDQALRDYTQAIKAKSNLAEAYAFRGALHDERKEKEEALHDYSEAIRLDHNAWWPLSRRGMLFSKEKEWDKAIADFSEAVRASPHYAAGYVERGLAYKGKGDWDSALANFDGAISVDSKSSRAYLQRAHVYRHRNEIDKEIENFTEAIQGNPKNQLLLQYRAEAYDHKGDLEHAIADFTAQINLTQSRRRRPYESRAREYARKGDYTSALSDFNKARQMEGDPVPYGKTLPWLLATCPDASFRDGKQALAEALKDCEATHWNNSNCIDTLAAAYAEEKDFEQAIAFEQLALQKPECDGGRKIDMEKRLALYQKHQPYRDTNKR